MSNEPIEWAKDAHQQHIEEPVARALQAAGINYLSRGSLYKGEQDRRNAMFKRMQQTLPADTAFFHALGVSKSLALTDPARLEPRFRQQFENAVCDCAIAAAHDSPVLRPVVTFDGTGREITEFYGRKRGPSGWMEQYTRQPQLMTRMGSAGY